MKFMPKNERIKNVKEFKNIIILLFFIVFLEIRNKKLPKNKKEKIEDSITYYETNYNRSILDFEQKSKSYEYQKTLIKKNGKLFIDKCLKKDFIVRFNYLVEKPLISAIIPVYNAEKTLYYSICSIQNQDITNFEIILIDDFSTDKSFKIMKKFQDIDLRIKILKNKKNMGSLFCRSIGVLISKGDYIFGLDNDDMFLSNDIFKFFVKYAQHYDFDIIGFRAFKVNNFKNGIKKMSDLYNYTDYPKDIIIHQPQLSTWIVSKNGKFYIHDMTIWAKCIKSKIYKEATIKLGKKRFSKFVSWGEDTIANFIIFNIAKSFKFIHKYGIIHLENKSTASYAMSKDIKLFGEIFFVDILYDFSKNNSDKNCAVYGAIMQKKILK